MPAGSMGMDEDLHARVGRLQGEIGELRGIVSAHIVQCTEDRIDGRATALRMDLNVQAIRAAMDSAQGSWKTVLGVGAFAAAVGAGAGKFSAMWLALIR